MALSASDSRVTYRGTDGTNYYCSTRTLTSDLIALISFGRTGGLVSATLHVSGD